MNVNMRRDSDMDKILLAYCAQLELNIASSGNLGLL